MSPKIILFGLTGSGSCMLQHLIDLGMDVIGVYTRLEPAPHPYFAVRSVQDITAAHNIPCCAELPTALSEPADLIISATYHHIIGEEVLATARLGAFNFHPSLLPAYGGATPTKQVILNGETVTGMTVHRMTANADAGEIIAQRDLPLAADIDDGRLRQHMAALQRPLLSDLLRFVETGERPPLPGKLPEKSYFQPLAPLAARYGPTTSSEELSRQVRASSPHPGLTLTIDDARYNVTRQLSFHAGDATADVSVDSAAGEGELITVGGIGGTLKLFGRRI